MPNLTPDDRTAWRGVVTLLERGNVSELNVASLSRSKAVIAVDARLAALEAAVAEYERIDREYTPSTEKVMSFSEWMSLTPGSRHKLNMLQEMYEKLAGLILTPVPLGEWNPAIGEEVERLARLLASQEVPPPSVIIA